jgi:hypothetical protein
MVPPELTEIAYVPTLELFREIVATFAFELPTIDNVPPEFTTKEEV